MTMMPTDLDVRVTATAAAIDAHIVDVRPDALAVFAELAPAQQRQLAADAWSIGLRALGNARAVAQESRLAEIGDRLVADLDAKLGRQLCAHQDALAASLAKFFDPTDGSVSRRLTEFVADEGALARQLGKHIGPHRSVLADTLAQLVGDASPLLRRLAPDGDESVVKAIEDRLAHAVAGSQRELERALDPNAEEGPIRRFMLSLREDLAKAELDRDQQLAAALAALDANNESSLISRLFRETQQARHTLLAAINPESPDSPMAAIRTSLEELITRNAARQEQLATETREAIARLDTRRTHQAKAPVGGLSFEDAVARIVVDTLGDGPYIAEPTGATAGSVARCKKGDLVVRFTGETAFAGANVVFEAKRDASYNLVRALDELEQAKKNRDAGVGVFVMATTHAPAGFPRFARHGSNVVVQWDESDPTTDVYLRCALFLGMGLVRRTQPAGNPADVDAVRDLGERIETEIARLDRMAKLNEGARKSVDGMEDELRKARRSMAGMLDAAQTTLRALHLDVVDESAENAAPLSFVDAVLHSPRASGAPQSPLQG